MKHAVTKMARLARLSLSPEENERFTKNLQDIVTWVEHLQEVDVSDVQDAESNASLLLREDEVKVTNSVEELMINAPLAKFNMFCVPKVVE